MRSDRGVFCTGRSVTNIARLQEIKKIKCVF